MTLRELLKKCHYKDVFNIIHQEYYRGKKSEYIYGADLGYRKAFEELVILPDKDSGEYQIYINEGQMPDDDDYLNSVDVCLYCNEDEQTYAMDFTPWEDLIDSEIKKGASMDDRTALAHVLWEMTFHGFSSEAVNEAKDELGEIVKGVENGERIDYEIGME